MSWPQISRKTFWVAHWEWLVFTPKDRKSQFILTNQNHVNLISTFWNRKGYHSHCLDMTLKSRRGKQKYKCAISNSNALWGLYKMTPLFLPWFAAGLGLTQQICSCIYFQSYINTLKPIKRFLVERWYVYKDFFCILYRFWVRAI